MTRPETGDDGPAYGQQLGDGLDEEFTPWVPGDPSTSDEAPTWETATRGLEGRHWTPEQDQATSHGPTEKREAGESEPSRGGRWWTEDNPRKLATGDRIRATQAVSDGLFATVRPGTTGRIISTDTSLFGTERATVDFDNGYTEEVRTEHLERRGWLD